MGERTRNVLIVVAWIGFIWSLIDTAIDNPVSETFSINFVYTVVLIGGAIALWLGLVVLIGQRLGKPNSTLVLATAIVLALLGVEVFWLHDWFAQRL